MSVMHRTSPSLAQLGSTFAPPSFLIRRTSPAGRLPRMPRTASALWMGWPDLVDVCRHDCNKRGPTSKFNDGWLGRPPSHTKHRASLTAWSAIEVPAVHQRALTAPTSYLLPQILIEALHLRGTLTCICTVHSTSFFGCRCDDGLVCWRATCGRESQSRSKATNS